MPKQFQPRIVYMAVGSTKLKLKITIITNMLSSFFPACLLLVGKSVLPSCGISM